MEKLPIFHQNHGITPLEKSQFFEFLNFLFFSPENHFFFLEYRETHFSGLFCLKWKDGKIANFLTEPWTKLNFSTIWTSCFHSLERPFFYREMKKVPFFNQNYLLSSLQKSQFLVVLNFRILYASKACFSF